MTVTSFDPNAEIISMTATAQRYFIKKLAAESKKGNDKIIRLSTKKSGCTGYAYVLDFVDGPSEGDDQVDFAAGITLSVDVEALKMLHGTEIDLVTEGINKVIKFNNPNVTAECGCGESFSVG